MIPGFIIAWITFPGVMVHELAHQLFCVWTGTKVLKVCYFRFENPAGYVIHERPASLWAHMLIGIGPLFVNTGLGVVIGIFALPFKHSIEPVYYLLMWLAVSIAMHSFPSTGDARSIWSAIQRPDSPFVVKVVGTPLVGLIFLGAFGSMFWLDLFYGIAVVITLPELLWFG
jgi:hypothetical protein